MGTVPLKLKNSAHHLTLGIYRTYTEIHISGERVCGQVFRILYLSIKKVQRWATL
jgi:hypothetical protein